MKRFVQNPVRKDKSATSKKISNLEIVIDKMHFSGHTDKWCRENCNPHAFGELNKAIIIIAMICLICVHRLIQRFANKLLHGCQGIRE